MSETYCRCGFETTAQLCPMCSSMERHTFREVEVVVARPYRFVYLTTGLALEALTVVATVWWLTAGPVGWR